jgi:hypothetical protein
MALTVEIVSGTMNVSMALPYIDKNSKAFIYLWNMQSHQDKKQKQASKLEEINK